MPADQSPPAERIDAIDALRGVAVLGILLINIPEFALPGNWQFPIRAAESQADVLVWIANQMFVEGSLRAIFSMLFGASGLLLLSRIERSQPAAAADIYYRRTLWLIVFGVIHAYVLLWPGEILYVYGIAGLALFPVRKLRSRYLLLAGALVLAKLVLGYGFWLYEDTRLYHAVTEARIAHEAPAATAPSAALDRWNRRLAQAHLTDEGTDTEIAAMRGGYLTILKRLAPNVIEAQSEDTYATNLWDALGMMLIGMGLLKTGVLTGRKTARFYAAMAIIAYAFGLTVRGVETHTLLAHRFSVLAQDTALLTYDTSRLAIALGHIGLVMALFRRFGTSGPFVRLAAAGRMALTNYVAQTVICVTFFYGAGFGFFARLSRHELYFVVLGIWAASLLWSPLWLRHFRFGPLEWCWRSLTYWHPQPMTRLPPPDGRSS